MIEYVKQLIACLLDIKNMSECDKLYNFVTRLQPWAHMDLKRQKLQDLQVPLGAADGLVDLRVAADHGGDDRVSMDNKESAKSDKGKVNKSGRDKGAFSVEVLTGLRSVQPI